MLDLAQVLRLPRNSILVKPARGRANGCVSEPVRGRSRASSTPRASWAVELQKGALPGNSNVTLFAGLNLGRADSFGRGVLLAEFLLSRSATKQSRARPRLRRSGSRCDAGEDGRRPRGASTHGGPAREGQGAVARAALQHSYGAVRGDCERGHGRACGSAEHPGLRRGSFFL